MDELTDQDFKDLILHKLARKDIWGKKHTDIVNVRRGFRRSEYGRADECAKELIKEGLLLRKKTPYGSGLHVSLNPRKKNEIMERIKRFF